MGTIWSDADIELLNRVYFNTTDDQLIILFPTRTIVAIKVKAKKLKLHRSPEFTFQLKSRNTMGSSNPMYGKVGANRGKTPSDVTKEKIRLSHLGKLGLIGNKNPMYGKPAYNRGIPPSTETVLKALETRRKNYNKLSSEQKENKLKKQQLHAIAVFSKFNRDRHSDYRTLPEQIVEDILISNNISYMFQYKAMYYKCDFYIQPNLIIEVQGDYWHANPMKYSTRILSPTQLKNISRDNQKFEYLTDRGFKILYIWEHDIYKNINIVKPLILNFINQDTNR